MVERSRRNDYKGERSRMKEAFEKILERLEEYEYNDLTEHNSELCEHCKRIDCENGMDCNMCIMDKAKEIVQEVEKEYNNGWISCSERLPEDNGVYFVTLDDDIMPRCIDVRNFRNGVFEQRFIVSPLQGKCLEEKVVAWMPLPEPYKEND